MAAAPCWIDGALVDVRKASVRVDDSAFLTGLGCYTTARAAGGRVQHARRHARRLRCDAARLGLGAVDEDACEHALGELARAAFGAGEGIVRLQASRDGEGALHVVGTTRPLDPDPPCWQVRTAPFPHDGPSPFAGAKLTGQPRLVLARELARRAGADEALLFDPVGRLVEGSRTNLFVVLESGELATPPLDRGAVAGIARALVLERVSEATERDVPEAELDRVRELVAVNAVRGARPVAGVDGRPVGAEPPGPWARRLAGALEPD